MKQKLTVLILMMAVAANSIILSGWNENNGWINDKTGTYYYAGNRVVKGIYEIDGAKYYFNEGTGRMEKCFVESGGKKYYFDKKTGRMVTGVKKIGDAVYTFGSEGELKRVVYGSKKCVALTYDDGPSENTERILGTLEENDGLATFFVVGSRISAYSKSLRRVSEMGCQIGNHTWAHKYLRNLSEKEIKKQISKCSDKIEEVTGRRPDISRTPGGDRQKFVRKAVDTPIVLWSLDTRDWESRNALKVFNAVMKKVSDGSIILMHDLYGSTAKASKYFVPELIKRGYQLVTLEELALLKGTELRTGSIYSNF